MALSHLNEFRSILNLSCFNPVRSIHLGRSWQPSTGHDDLAANLSGDADLREKRAKKVEM
jgi:hypothetical protein